MHGEWAVLVHLAGLHGPVTGPFTRSPGSWPSPRALIVVVSRRLFASPAENMTGAGRASRDSHGLRVPVVLRGSGPIQIHVSNRMRCSGMHKNKNLTDIQEMVNIERNQMCGIN